MEGLGSGSVLWMVQGTARLCSDITAGFVLGRLRRLEDVKTQTIMRPNRSRAQCTVVGLHHNWIMCLSLSLLIISHILGADAGEAEE